MKISQITIALILTFSVQFIFAQSPNTNKGIFVDPKEGYYQDILKALDDYAPLNQRKNLIQLILAIWIFLNQLMNLQDAGITLLFLRDELAPAGASLLLHFWKLKFTVYITRKSSFLKCIPFIGNM